MTERAMPRICVSNATSRTITVVAQTNQCRMGAIAILIEIGQPFHQKNLFESSLHRPYP